MLHLVGGVAEQSLYSLLIYKNKIVIKITSMCILLFSSFLDSFIPFNLKCVQDPVAIIYIQSLFNVDYLKYAYS